MLYIGIDVAKQKHDCFITNANGEALTEVFTVQNTKDGFGELIRRIKMFQKKPTSINVKIGLEATGHYSDNIVGFLRKNGLYPVILNPLQVNLYRKSRSLRKTKTDKSDARFIAKLLMAYDFKPITVSSYHSEELKSLTRHRKRMIDSQSKLKVLSDRLISIMFPELESFVSDTLGTTMRGILLEFPNTDEIAACHLTHLASLAETLSRGRLGKDWVIALRELAKNSVGQNSPAKSFELRQTLRQLETIGKEIELVEYEIKSLVIRTATSLTTIPGISYTLAAIIIAEIGNITRFATPEKLQAFAGLDPTTYQSGQFTGTRAVMVKRGSAYLRWALLMAARTVSRHDKTFGEYLDRKLAEGKHYNAAMGHVAKKLIRVIFHLMSTGETYQPAA